MKKLIRNLLLLALLTLCFTLPAHAAEEVTFDAASYTTGAITSKSSNGKSLSMGKNKYAGYKIDFDNSPSKITLEIGTAGVNAGTMEIRLDTTSGKLLGTIKANASSSWVRAKYTVYVTEDISGPHTIFVLFKSGTHDFHSISFYVSDPEESYHSFSEEDRFNDIRDNSIRSEINLMADLGILGTEKASFDGNQLVTKREFMRALTAFYRNKVTSIEDEILFSDVVQGSEDFELVRWLCGIDVLEADPNKALNPGGALTMEDSAQMLCNLLDYTEVVEAKGSTLTVARSLGLLSGVTVGQSGKMKHQEMAQILWNALESKYNKLVGVTHDNYLIYDADTNILKQTGGIYMAEGIITANQSNNLYSNTQNAPVGAVLIDDEIYYCDKTAAASYLGFNCIYFYEEQGSKRILRAIRPSGDTEYMYLRSDEYDLGDITEDVVVYYDDKDKEKELDIESHSVIMYNGRRLDDMLSKLIGTEDFCGSILMIDNDGNGKYDVVMIEHAETIILGGVTKTSVYDSLTEKNIMFDDTERIRLIYGTMNGTWNELAFGTLLDMYRSKNKTGDILIRMYPVNSTKIGMVSEMDGDGTITFEDGSVYEAYSTTKRPMVIGKSITLKLNSYGRYVDYILGTPTQVGLVLDKGTIGSGLNRGVAIRMLTEDNEIKIYDFANSVYADGVICKTIEEINGGKEKFAGLNGMEDDSVVLYALNGNGEISMLDTAAPGAGGVYDVLTQTVSEEKYVVRGTYLSKVAGGKRGQDAILGKGYKLINLSTTGNEEEHLFGGALAAGDMQRILTGYSLVPDSMITNIVVWHRGYSNDKQGHFMLAKKLLRADDNKEPQIVLEGINASGSITYVVNKYAYDNIPQLKKTVDSIMPGDMLQCSVNSAGEATNIIVNYFHDGAVSNSAGVTANLNKNKYYLSYDDSRGKMYKGEVVACEDNYVKICTYDGSGNEFMQYLDTSLVKIVSCDKDGNNQWISNVGGVWLGVGQEILLCTNAYSANPNFAVIYR